MANLGAAGVLTGDIRHPMPWLVLVPAWPIAIDPFAYYCGIGTWVQTCLAIALGRDRNSMGVGGREWFHAYGMALPHHVPSNAIHECAEIPLHL